MGLGTILIVDDTPTNLGILFDVLVEAGFKVLVAQDGESAIQKVEYAAPDLILLDILMPGQDGFETCKRLKSKESTQDIPIIFMTALSETEDKVKGLQLGAVDYITKPLQHEEVLARVKLQLDLRNLHKQLQAQNLRLAQQIEERQQAEVQIRAQATLLDKAQDAIFVLDPQDQIVFWNQSAERLFGWSAAEAKAATARQLLFACSPESERVYQQVMQEGEWHGELHPCIRDEPTGTSATRRVITVESRWTLVRDEEAVPKSILVVNTDITEKKQLERQFLQAQRMESIGTLASGIAHDLNNLLAPILMSTQLLKKKPHDAQSQQWLEILETNTKRGAELLKQVMAFARGVGGEKGILQPRHLLVEIKKIMEETFPKLLTYEIDIAPDLWTVQANSTQLHQVLINLCVNARDAMPHYGTLRLSAANIEIDEFFARTQLDAQVGPYVVFTVADTGMGIPPDVLDKIFEPFFTTKEIGRGTGLGLSTASGIIKSHGGFITVVSEVGQGTEFKVYLPATRVAEPQLAEVSELPMGHQELILVVDDELPIREITKTFLEAYNYKALTACDGIEAISEYVQHKHKISLVMVDMLMPSMDGITTIRTLRTIDPNVKIVAVSGNMSSDKLAEITSSGVSTFLAKPYTTEKLLTTLHSVLRGEP